jgi:Na+/H+ antiporter NhaD/arsenite permease-like protein
MILRGSLRGRPAVNLAMLLIGTLLASWIGTTGASMLLIRPVLRANAWRRHKAHVVVFFIFLVANIGGSLTPLGDPPLFLGFLHGVDFFWTLHLAPTTGFVAALVLAAFFALDSYYYRREGPAPDDGEKAPLRFEGLPNLAFFGGIMGAVLFSGLVHLGGVAILGVTIEGQDLVRDGVILAMGGASLYATKAQVRRDNEFTWAAIQEVAILFAGIFTTIAPALAILKAGEHGSAAPLIAAVSQPWHFFWASGGLSSFLDNAPTYLTFFSTAIGKLYPDIADEKTAAALLMGKEAILAQHPTLPSGFKFLEAISAGSVFMGANTYIGNAPNFMVKSIAEEAGVAMPSFFGYMFKYSIPVLVTVFIATTFVFFA